MLNKIDRWLTQQLPAPHLIGIKRFNIEFLFFGLKEIRACLFAGLFFIAMFITPKAGLLGLPRYDILLIFAILVQLIMFYTKFETVDPLLCFTLSVLY